MALGHRKGMAGKPGPKPQPKGVADTPAEDGLIEAVMACARDPLRFVLLAFPWGEKGTMLAEKTGPDDWQREVLEKVKAGLSPEEAVQVAVSSGHGIGKSALVAWLILWAMSTFPDCRGVVTANTEPQLKTKTWPELAKWYNLLICRHWFHFTATAIFSVEKRNEKTWRIDMVPWSETNTEAFAGLHNEGKRILLIMDEASGISDKVWEVAEGALTDANTEIMWFAFGNPTRNTGRFRECFGSRQHRWQTKQIDSRTVKITNKSRLGKWVEDYGEDSDFVRVRVRGVFPRAGSLQFVPSSLVAAAMDRAAICDPRDPLVIGVDIARHGDDKSVIFPRKGRDARTLPFTRLRIPDTMQLAARIALECEQLRPDGVFVDVTGIGWGVFDRLNQMGVPNLFAVKLGGSPDAPFIGEKVRVANKRTEMWSSMREWLKGGAIPNETELESDLISVEYGFSGRDDAIQLEKKKDMKRRGLASPDIADGLSLTFAYPVFPRNHELDKLGPFDTIPRPRVYDAMNEDWQRDAFQEKWTES